MVARKQVHRPEIFRRRHDMTDGIDKLFRACVRKALIGAQACRNFSVSFFYVMCLPSARAGAGPGLPSRARAFLILPQRGKKRHFFQSAFVFPEFHPEPIPLQILPLIKR